VGKSELTRSHSTKKLKTSASGASTFVLILAFSLLLSANSFAQTPVTLGPVPKAQFLDANGAPLSGGLLFTYQAGTNIQLATYTDSTGLVANSDPVVLDSAGRANVWFLAQAYKIVLQNSSGVTQYTVDNYGVPPFLSGNNAWTGNETHAGTETFNGPVNLNNGGSMAGIFSGSPTISGNWNFTGTPIFSNSPIFAGNITASQFISTAPSGTPPLVVSSATKVTDLNVGFIDDCFVTGSPIANAVLQATSGNQCAFSLTNHILDVANINGTVYPSLGAQHSVPVMTTASTNVSYKVVPNCTTALGFTQSTDTWTCTTTIQQSTSAAGCVTGSTSGNPCTTTLTWPVAFADTSYIPVCSGGTIISGEPVIEGVENLTTTTVDVITVAKSNASAQSQQIYCIAMHP